MSSLSSKSSITSEEGKNPDKSNPKELNPIEIHIVTPLGRQIKKQVFSVLLPGESGYFGVLKSHCPLISLLQPGLVRIKSRFKTKEAKEEVNEEVFSVSGGFAQIIDNKISLLAENIFFPEDITPEFKTRYQNSFSYQLKEDEVCSASDQKAKFFLASNLQ